MKIKKHTKPMMTQRGHKFNFDSKNSLLSKFGTICSLCGKELKDDEKQKYLCPNCEEKQNETSKK